MTVSPNMSFEGFSWMELIKHNIKYLKEIAKWGVAALVAFGIGHQPWLEVPLTMLGKAALDSLEFFIREMNLD